jgi:hypothetical protein
MARGQLGIKILEYFQENPGPHTIKEIKEEALPETSGGAIQYALDKLIGEGRTVKLNGRPAKYHATASCVVPEPPASEPEKPPESPVAEKPIPPPPPPPSETRKEGFCGHCTSAPGAIGKDLAYHERFCPVMIPGAAGGANWYCKCGTSGHPNARDYEERQAGLRAAAENGGNKDKLMSCPCGRGDYDLCTDCSYDFCSVHGAEGAAGER